MTPSQLRRHIKRLPAGTPLHKTLEVALQEGVGFGTAWFGSQKEHWLGWLKEYSGQGAYGRKPATSARDARYVYNHIQCAPMLFWLAEALDTDETDLNRAYHEVIHAGPNGAARCAVFRQRFPWQRIEAAIATTQKRRWWLF